MSDATVLFHARASEAFGLGASETKALGFIQRFGPMTHRDLTERIGLKPASVSNIIDRLEEKGWVHRQRSEEDGRRVLLTAVPAKVDAFRRQVFGPLMQRLDRVYEELDTQDLVLVAKAFELIAAAQKEATSDLENLDHAEKK